MHPEFMVKVSGGASTLGGVKQHMAYIGRDKELTLEMDTGDVALVKGVGRESWRFGTWRWMPIVGSPNVRSSGARHRSSMFRTSVRETMGTYLECHS